MRVFRTCLVTAAVVAMSLPAVSAMAADNCSFADKGTTRTLKADCTTDSTILIPDGYTLDGNGKTITAVDPTGDHFRGGVVANGGSVAHVRSLTVTASGLTNVCDGGDDRLRGILFDGASGSITKSTVTGINQGASGCQEGNAIEVRNAPFDGTHPATVSVEIAHNNVTDWQKTGIVVNGDAVASVHHNKVGASATQANLAANSIQFGFGSSGSLMYSQIAGNQWCCTNEVATAVLIFDADGVTIRQNNFEGNADIGIYGFGDGLTIDNNKVFENGTDTNAFGWDIGIGNYGTGNVVTNNKVRGYSTPYDGVTGGNNKVVPGGPID